MSKRKAASQNGKRKPYKSPALRKLSPEEAKAMLEARAVPGDEQAKKLLEEINRQLARKPE